MSASEPNELALISVGSTSLTKIDTSLAARGLQALRITEDADYWLKKGKQLADQGRHEEAFACYERGIALSPDHPELQCALGSCHYTPAKVRKRITVQAHSWYRKAADQGHVDAQLHLGVLYDCGYGVPEDNAEAVAWYRKAADQGSVIAMECLGGLYCFGEGVLQDYVQAATWFRKAAEQGSENAQLELGLLYHRGEGVTRDDAEAAEWFLKAAEQGNPRAQFEIGLFYLNGTGVPQDFDQASYWYSKAAKQGFQQAEIFGTILKSAPTL